MPLKEDNATPKQTDRVSSVGPTPDTTQIPNPDTKLRGDADGLADDLAEARRLFSEMGVSGWDDYTMSIEG